MKIEYIGKCLLIVEGGEKIIVIGDLHLGYEQALEKMGIALGRKMFDERIKEFDELFKVCGKVNKIILLGDVKHGFSRGNEQEWEEVRKLLKYFRENLEKGGEIVILKGNHDNYLENIVGKKMDELIGTWARVEEHYLWNEIIFVHGDKDYEEIWEKGIEWVIIGHVHPVINLDDGVKVERYKCFMEGEIMKGKKKKKIIVVPSFLENEKGVDVREINKSWPWEYEIDKFRIRVVGEDLKVLDFGKISKLKN